MSVIVIRRIKSIKIHKHFNAQIITNINKINRGMRFHYIFEYNLRCIIVVMYFFKIRHFVYKKDNDLFIYVCYILLLSFKLIFCKLKTPALIINKYRSIDI